MEKAKDIERSKNIESILNHDEKGPKTIVKEDLIQMKGDPLGLRVSLDDDIKYDRQSKKVKKMDEVVVERYNPDATKGLTSEDVESRQLAGLVNVGDKGSTKSIASIVISNLVTFFNFLILLITIWLVSVGASLTNFFFVLIVSANIGIGIIQEIRAKKTIDKLSLLSAPTSVVIRDGDDK